MSEQTKEWGDKIKSLRQKIYLIESRNLRRKDPKKDSEIVDEIIKTISAFVEKEGD